jgi:hypothetical protein
MARPRDPLVVTIADAGYYQLARELIGSVRQHQPEAAVGLLDVGLTAEQRKALAADGVEVVAAKWNFPGSQPKELPRQFLAMLSRPFLPQYFPKAKTIVYLDADCWVQHPDAVAELAAAAGKADVAVVPEIHPAFGHLYNPGHWARDMHLKAYASVYGRSTPSPAEAVVINSGVLAAKTSSPMWKAWQETLAAAVAARRNPIALGQPCPLASADKANHFIEQNALYNAFQRGMFRIFPMSALYNWVCTLAAPMLDPATGLLVEPTPPHAPIRVVHLTGQGKEAAQVSGLDGQRYDRSWRWSGLPPISASQG